jgi:hypothetical protein
MKNPKLITTIDEREWTYLGSVLDLKCEGGFGLVYCKAGIFAVFDKRQNELIFIRYLTREEALENILSIRASRLLT